MSFAYSWLAVSGKSPDDTLRDLGLTLGNTYEGFPNGNLSGIMLPTGWYLVVSERCDYANTRRLRRLSKRCELVTCAVEEHVMYASTSGWKNGKHAWEITHDSQSAAGRHHLDATGKLPPMFDEIRTWYAGEQAAMDQSNQLVDCTMEVPIETARRITGFSFHDTLPGEGKDLFHHLDRDPTAKKWWQFWRR
ncbi:hypothetical protein Pan97_03450 [Bremerella volcania]|uniref:Uncharacterized protein n=1 Tax=Bremerella volcania TaxID=2527984 RepID=A0A518C2B6_9BACT|nr:hypothetical protein [Bremerella volcania]QDU73375.1 hypothetical protein Pan97_03450 [Bremerella volcania]